MIISDFTYVLPPERIAIHPPRERGSSKLLFLNKTSQKIEESMYKNLPDYFEHGDVLVLNNTKVFKARLILKNKSDKKIELIVLEKHKYTDYRKAFFALYKGKVNPGETYFIGNEEIKIVELQENGIAKCESSCDVFEITEKYGEVPIPPYLRRKSDLVDFERYQTTFAQQTGSVAAPTASLNFTSEIEEKLKEKGVIIEYITLHVGLGTFLPIRSESIEGHTMHSEYFQIPVETIQSIRAAKMKNKKVFALGTTVVRTLEFAAEMITADTEPKTNIEGEANIFIYPGYSFKIIDAMITNFHAPKSTVLMMAGAFAGWDFLMKGYTHAIQKKYSFLSYGDSMLIV